jgi:hypothetical protein
MQVLQLDLEDCDLALKLTDLVDDVLLLLRLELESLRGDLVEDEHHADHRDSDDVRRVEDCADQVGSTAREAGSDMSAS